MLKKAIIGTLFVALTAGFLLGRDCVSYMRTMGNSVREAVKSEIDLDFEIKRADDMINQLTPAIERAHEKVITQQTALKRMEIQVAKRETELDKQEQLIVARRDHLESGNENFKFAGVSYRRAELKRDLELRFDSFKRASEALNHEKKIMLARRETLSANIQTLTAMKSQREELKVAVAELEARVEQLKAEEAIQKLAINGDSELSEATQLIERLTNEIEVKEAMQSATGDIQGLIPAETDAPSDGDIASQIDSYFGTVSDDTPQTAEETLDPAV